MANVSVSSSAWTELSITSGTVQNVSATADIELSAEQVNNSGVVLKPSEIYQWDNETIYARAVTENTGALRVVNFKKAAGGGGSYVLPVATASKLGGVKIGSNVTVAEDGTISVAAPYSLPTAAANTLGGVKVGSGLSITDGVLSASGDPVGRVVFDVILRDGYIKANGATVADASTSVPNLLQFVQSNPLLLAANQAAYDENHGLYLYDNGTDTLTLPNFIGKFVEGGNTVEEKEAGLPNIKGWYSGATGYYGNTPTASITQPDNVNGVLYDSKIGGSLQKVTTTIGSGAGWYGTTIDIKASNSNSIYSDSVSTVQPPAITLIPQIKY